MRKEVKWYDQKFPVNVGRISHPKVPKRQALNIARKSKYWILLLMRNRDIAKDWARVYSTLVDAKTGSRGRYLFIHSDSLHDFNESWRERGNLMMDVVDVIK